MGCLKTLAYVGAAAMVATSALIASPAAAADLGAPPMMAPPPPPPMMDGMSGLYLRGDIGVSHYGDVKYNSRFLNTNAAAALTGFGIDQSSFDNVAFGGVGIGYQFNNFLRFDITGEMRTSSKFHAVEGYTSFCGVARCYDVYNASIGTNVFMANGYVDLGTWGGFTPFVGVGVGIANHKVKGLQDVGLWPNQGFGIAPDSSKSEFAWALMAGVGFDVTRNLKLEAGYRYLNMGDVDSNPIDCKNTPTCLGEVHTYKMASHDLKIGFRYLFGGDAPPSMPGPALVRKY